MALHVQGFGVQVQGLAVRKDRGVRQSGSEAIWERGSLKSEGIRCRDLYRIKNLYRI